ncbi:MAG: hypothetical protein L6R42_002036 [Xanthoria sp. 1 TBL-2021]|nr:MAG: hypothetical protein L6R42_002036 [Xanthoria sp. 1 TBL-2021]
MAWAFGDNFQSQPFSGKPPGKPLRDVDYTAEFDDRYYSQMESQASLKMYLGTLYKEHQTLITSLSRKLASSNQPTPSAATAHQSTTASGPNVPTGSSNDNNDSSDGRAVEPTDEPPSFEFQNQPLRTLTDLDNDANNDINHPSSDDNAEIRNVNRLIVSQIRDINDMQREIALLEVGNENLKLRLEGIEIGEELQRRRAPVARMIDWEEVKVGESSKGMSEEMEGIRPSIERDEYSGFEGGIAPSIERDEYGDFEEAEKERMQFIESKTPMQEYMKYLDGMTPLQEYTKRLESQMAESVETAKRNREIDEELFKGERNARVAERQNPYARKTQDTKASHGLPRGLNHTQAWW